MPARLHEVEGPAAGPGCPHTRVRGGSRARGTPPPHAPRPAGPGAWSRPAAEVTSEVPTCRDAAPRYPPRRGLRRPYPPLPAGARSGRGAPRPARTASEAGPDTSLRPRPLAARRDGDDLVPPRYLSLPSRASPRSRWPLPLPGALGRRLLPGRNVPLVSPPARVTCGGPAPRPAATPRPLPHRARPL